MSVRNMDSFENNIKEAFEGYKEQYSPAAWERMKANLPANQGGTGISGKVAMIAGGAVLVAGLAGLAYWGASDAPVEAAVEPAALTIPSEEFVQEPAPVSNDLVLTQAEEEKSNSDSPETKAEEPALAQVAVTPEPDVVKAKSILAAVQMSADKVCIGTEISLNVGQNGNIRWEMGDGVQLHGNAVRHRYSEAGTYTPVALIIDNNGKVLKQVKGNALTVHPSPNPKFEYQRYNPYEKPEIDFSVLEASEQNVWSFEKGTSGDIGAEVSHIFIRAGRYPVKHIAINEFGCKDSSIKNVLVTRGYNLMAPTTFNPDKESWIPIGLKQADCKFDLKIVDENGNVAFKTTNCNFEWDGVNQSTGEMSKEGQIYGWAAVVKDENGRKTEYGGVINILSE